MLVALLLLAIVLAGCTTPRTAGRGDRWWKGATHLHSRWSDGASYPEVVANWYENHDFNFIVVTDHNNVQQGEKWLDARKTRAAVAEYRDLLGDEWVTVKGSFTNGQVRCRPLDEYRGKVEVPGKFIVMRGEEITCKNGDRQVHVVAVNLSEFVKPVTGKSVVETFERSILNVSAQAEKHGRPMVSILCHPNWGRGPSVGEIWQSDKVRHFELVNGQTYSEWNTGNQVLLSCDRLWDVALTKRIESGIDTPLYGVAADDMHRLADVAGSAWIMVRAPVLDPDAIASAIYGGNFYSTTGVLLADVDVHKRSISVEVEAEEGVAYTIQFIGTRSGYDESREETKDDQGRLLPPTERYSRDIGMVLQEIQGHRATYKASGDELYVRVKVTSSEMISGPKGKKVAQAAWSQPLVLR